MTKSKWNAGRIALILFLLTLGTFIPTSIWHDANSIGPGDLGMGLLMGLLCLLVWGPMLIASLVTSLVSIAKKRGQKQGIATLVGLSLVVIWIFMSSPP